MPFHIAEDVTLSPNTHVLSVDVEDWPTRSCWESTHFLLDLFDEHGATATFFVLGEVAQQQPKLVQEIHRRGHEVGSHAWRHIKIHTMEPSVFAEHMGWATDTLQQLIGEPVVGFRAPFFSIVRSSYWALDVLMEAGYKYDSSIFPFRGPVYGIPEFPQHAVRIRKNGHSIIEVPMSTVDMMGRRLPVSGGGYFRLLPSALIHRSVKRVEREGRPFIAYCHPYEFDADTLRSPSPISFKTSVTYPLDAFKTNLFRKGVRGKMKRLLNTFTFRSMREVLHHDFQ